MKRFSFPKYWLATGLLAVALATADAQNPTDRAPGGSSAGGPGAGAGAPGANTDKPAPSTSSTRADEKAAAGGKAGGTQGALSKQDQQFVQKAAQGGMLEVRLGELASQKAANPKVKELGATMVKDHSQVNKELNDLAEKKGLVLSTELDSKHQGTVEKFSKLSGEEFDKAYVKELVSAHKKDVSEFEKASKSAADADVKAWAGKTLPALQGHLQHVQEMQKSKE